MYIALLIVPLVTFSCLALCARYIGSRGTIILSMFSCICCFLLSLIIFYEVTLCAVPCQLNCAIFAVTTLFDAHWSLLYDPLSSVMCLVVTFVSGLVLLYSCSYMISDPHFIRFISYLHLFTLAMLLLVTADNYVQLFIGWESVGLASYLLISFWFTRLQASKAAIQAMLLNRVGDLALALGIMCLFFTYNTTNYQALYASVANYHDLQAAQCIAMYTWDAHTLHTLSTVNFSEAFSMNLLDIACLLLFIGACGKSGQFGLHSWLPNAMNAPTPVSALLHAATMVTAGVFLLARTSPLLEFAPITCAIVTIIGAITTVFAGLVGMVQHDFKSIIAYSTCSQLGYMITVCGISNYDLGIFHLFTHSFFKALLFLSAGAIIHALANQQDIRKFAGLQSHFVYTYCCLLIGTLALVGTPFLSAFYSKDVILEYANSTYSFISDYAFVLTCFSVFTTSYYSFRLLYAVFFNSTNVSKSYISQAHDADVITSVVLAIFSIGAIFAGWLCQSLFIGLGTDMWNNSTLTLPSHSVLVEAEFLPQSVKLVPLVFILLGALVAFYLAKYPHTLLYKAKFKQYKLKHYQVAINYFYPLYTGFTFKAYFDLLLNMVVAYPMFNLGFHLTKVFDKGLLELLPISGVGIGQSMRMLSNQLAYTQSGFINHYAVIMIISALCSVIVISFPAMFAIDLRLMVILFTCVAVV